MLKQNIKTILKEQDVRIFEYLNLPKIKKKKIIADLESGKLKFIEVINWVISKSNDEDFYKLIVKIFGKQLKRYSY